MKENIINFAVYEDGKEYLGLASATLPSLTAITNSISGAGLSGNIEVPTVGHFDAMTLTLNFNSVTQQVTKLSEPRKHNIDLRIAQQQENPSSANFSIGKIKHVLVVVPKTYNAGSVAPASATDASGEYAVHYWATYIDGKRTQEIDPINFKCVINGVDYLADVRSALGK